MSCVVAGRADAAHRADHVVAVELVDQLPGPELRPAVGVQHAAGHLCTLGAAAGDGVVERGEGDPGLHP
jgi:hypothetical protein